MPRCLRIQYPGAWYHVMNRGLGRRNIFFGDKDRKGFLKLLGDISESFHAEIHAYSLMDNHYHLLIHTPHGNIARVMRHVNGVYTQIFNKRNRTDGPLMRGRYKSLLVDTDEYLLELVRYIHLNPVEAGLCGHPKEHIWSSHLAYFDKSKRPSWLRVEEVLSRFGIDEAKSLYELDKFVCAGVPELFQKTIEDQRFIVGSEAFREWIYNNFGDPKIAATHAAIQNRQTDVWPKVNYILNLVACTFNTTVAQIAQPHRGKKNNARSMSIYLIRKMTGLKHAELARWMNVENEKLMSKSVARFETRLACDQAMQKLVEKVKNKILYDDES